MTRQRTPAGRGDTRHIDADSHAPVLHGSATCDTRHASSASGPPRHHGHCQSRRARFFQLPKRGKPRINAPCYAKLPRDSSVTVAPRNRARRPRESQIRIGNLYAAYLCKTGDTLAPRAIPNDGDLSLPASHTRLFSIRVYGTFRRRFSRDLFASVRVHDERL